MWTNFFEFTDSLYYFYNFFLGLFYTGKFSSLVRSLSAREEHTGARVHKPEAPRMPQRRSAFEIS